MCGHRNVAMNERPQAASTLVRARPDELVTDLDRERAVEQLRLHVGQGRLSLDEFGQRVDEALAAQTGAELAGALRGLPRLRSAAELRRQRQSIVRPYLVVSALLVVIWAATGFGFPWPLFPLVGWGLPVLRESARLRAGEVGVSA